MNVIVDSLAYWLADFYLAAAMLLAAALVAMAVCRQPAKRLAVAKAAIVAAALLAGLCALPGWSLFSLGGGGTQDATIVVSPQPVTAVAELPRGLAMEPLPQVAPDFSQVAALPVEANREIPWLSAIVGGYFVGTAAVAMWLVAGVIAAARLVRRADDFPEALCHLLSDDLHVEQLLVSGEIDVPVALGVFRPRESSYGPWGKS